ncbi:MAG: hypothetical protein HC927_07910 [Deltaproteobacteria bacterium]|nr:hypothetical protein [Deltaproteobacteria bacterium]
MDGSTHWRCRAPPGGWSPLIEELRERAQQGDRVVSVPTREGEIQVAFEIVAGELHLERREWDLYVRRGRARLELRTQALLTEPIAAWYTRELPRVTRWLFGRWPAAMTGEELVDELQQLGWRTSQLEVCADVIGFMPLKALVAEACVTKLRRFKPTTIPTSGVVTGIEIGKRQDNPLSLTLYDKLLRLATRSKAERAAWEAGAIAAGWRGEAVTRIEFHFNHQALKIGKSGSESAEVDGEHVGACLTRDTIQRLWAYGAQQIRFVDLEHGRAKGIARPRDYPELPHWRVIREAADRYAGERLVRIAASAELAACVEQAELEVRRTIVRRAFLSGARSVDEVREDAPHHVARVLACEGVVDADLRRCEARYGELIEQANCEASSQNRHHEKDQPSGSVSAARVGSGGGQKKRRARSRPACSNVSVSSPHSHEIGTERRGRAIRIAWLCSNRRGRRSHGHGAAAIAGIR